MDTDQTLKDHISIAEAATRLGISPEAVRKRIQRGTLQAYKVGRAWYVLMEPRPDSDQPQEETVKTQPDSTGQLVEQMREEIAFLRQQLERKDVIIQTLAQRLPELPPGRGDVDEAINGDKKQRRWWRLW